MDNPARKRGNLPSVVHLDRRCVTSSSCPPLLSQLRTKAAASPIVLTNFNTCFIIVVQNNSMAYSISDYPELQSHAGVPNNADCASTWSESTFDTTLSPPTNRSMVSPAWSSCSTEISVTASSERIEEFNMLLIGQAEGPYRLQYVEHRLREWVAQLPNDSGERIDMTPLRQSASTPARPGISILAQARSLLRRGATLKASPLVPPRPVLSPQRPSAPKVNRVYLDFALNPQHVPPVFSAPFSSIATSSITETFPSASIPFPSPIAVLDSALVADDLNSDAIKQPSHVGFQNVILPPNIPKNVCLRCCVKSKREGYQFCSDKCTDIVAAEPLPQLLRVPIGHSMEQHLKKRLAERWYKPGRVPQIESIHMITWPNVMRTSFEHYRDSVVAQRKNPTSEPAEFKFFTSETRNCRLGEDGNRETCKSPACHLCQAIVTGFKSTLVRNRQRAKDGFSLDVPFGGGIYMTPCASRATGLAQQQNKGGTGTVALLVTRTVPGRKHHVKRPDHRMTNAGKGFDSVHSGDVDTDREELVVYNEDAVRPAYLMILKP